MATTKIPAELVAINAIQGTLIADNAITAVHIATNAVSGTLVADNAITSTHIAQNNVTATQIAQNTITVTQIADSAVETAKINNDAVTQAKIADDAVGPDQLAANAVVSASIANGTIVEADMADNAVTLAKMASLARGSVIVGDSAGDPAALAIGSNTYVLSSDGTDVSWAAAGGGVDGISSSADATAITIGSDENVTFSGNITSVANLYVADDIGHAGDSDTYMSFENNYLGFYTGGVNTLVLNNGNVGIGATPSNRLDVVGTGSTKLKITNTDTNWAALDIQAGGNQSNYMFFRDESAERARIQITDTNDMLFSNGSSPAERMRIGSSGASLGDTDGDYVSRNNTGGLHVKRGGILMNGPPGDANMSSAAADNCWTYHGQGGRGGSFTSLKISVPNPNNGSSGVGYGGFSLEFYIAGYNAKYHSGHFSGYVNGGITLSKRAFWDSSGSGTLSSGSVGVQGFYLTIGFPSMTHPTCKFVINKGGHGVSGPYTNMSGVSVTWT
jgi:PIN domain nuclease of toxin-antitoxin system